MRTRRMLAAGVVATSTALLLSACVAFPTSLTPVDDRDRPDRGSSRDDDRGGDPQRGPEVQQGDGAQGDDELRCDGDSIDLTGAGREFDLEGQCGTVTVEGEDIEVDAESIEVLILRGARNQVDAESIGSIEIEGQDTEVDVDRDVDDVTVRGERNSVEVDGGIDSVVIEGSDNEVLADARIGSIDDAGERNAVREND